MPININMHIYYFKAFTQVGRSSDRKGDIEARQWKLVSQHY